MIKPDVSLSRKIKRAADVIFASGMLVCLSPVLGATAAAVRFSMGSPVLFKQKRRGYKEKIFTLYKFRTMTDERDENGELLRDAERITQTGKIIRSLSLDELPQLWNVLKGNMSLIGPRPLLVDYLPLYTAEQRRRHDVPPGIVGWAGVNGRNANTWDKKFEMDLWYVGNWSLLLDLKIFLKAILAVLSREGISYGNEAAGVRFAGIQERPMDYPVRDFTVADGPAILELFEKVFGRRISLGFWKWRYPEGLGEPVVKLMFDGDALIGHYAVTALPLLLQGEKRRAAFSMTTMTHPDYQGKGIFTKLAKMTYEAAADRGFSLVFGFPNKNSEWVIFNRLGWSRSTSINEYRLDSFPLPLTTPLAAKEPAFDRSYDEFWANNCTKLGCCVSRTADFLNWRVKRCPTEYRQGSYLLFEDRIAGGGLRGFLIFKVYTGEARSKGHVLELLAADNETAGRLLASSLDYARRENVANVSAWLYRSHPNFAAFTNGGFSDSGNDVVWGGRWFSGDDAAAGEFFNRWHLSMLDSDVF